MIQAVEPLAAPGLNDLYFHRLIDLLQLQPTDRPAVVGR